MAVRRVADLLVDPLAGRLEQGLGLRVLVEHIGALAACEGEGAGRLGVDQVVAAAVQQVKAQPRRQVGGELAEQLLEVDVDHHHAARALLRVDHRGGHLQIGLRSADRLAVALQAGVGQEDRPGRPAQGLVDIGLVALLEQLVALDAAQRAVRAVDADALHAMRLRVDQAQLQVLGVRAHDAFHQQRRVALETRLQLRRLGTGEQPRRLRMEGKHQHVACPGVERQRQLARQHPGGGLQAILGAGDQQLAAGAVAVVAGQPGGQCAGERDHQADAPGQAQLHPPASSCSKRRRPARMPAHRRSRRAASSTGSSQTSRPCEPSATRSVFARP